MSRVTWGDSGTRFYETGVDRGVLYVNNVGVAWSGITSVSESPTGGDAKPYYMDGIKYLNIAGSEEFEATLEALSAPSEFGPCDGHQSINNGLVAHQQPRKAFGLSYRTLVGNDTLGASLGYKIHLVYNALAAPAERQYNSTGASSDPTAKSWALTTLPPSLTGMKPTAHFVIDSRKTPKMLLVAIEDILYGNDSADARLPLVSELVTLFKSEGPRTRTNYLWNPSFRYVNPGTTEIRRNIINNPNYKTLGASGEVRRNLSPNPNFELDTTTWGNYTGGAVLTRTTAAAYSGTNGLRVTSDGAQLIPRVGQFLSGLVSAGQVVTLSYRTRLVAGTGWATGATPYSMLRGAKNAGGEWSVAANPTLASLTPDANGWYYVSVTATVDADTTGQIVTNLGWSNGATPAPNTAQWDIDEVLLEKAPTVLPYFDGSTAAANSLTYSWVGTANASASIATGTLSQGASLIGYNRKAWTGVGAAPDGSNTSMSYIGSSSTSVSASSLVLFCYEGATTPGDVVAGRFKVRLRGSTTSYTVNPTFFAYSSAGAGMSAIYTAPSVVIPADGSWVDVVIPGTTAPANSASVRFYITTVSSMSTPAIIETAMVLEEKVAAAGNPPRPFFSGSTPNADGLTYSWVGTAEYSQSIATGLWPGSWNCSGTVHRSVVDGKGGYFAEVSKTGIFYSNTVNAGVASVGEYWAARVVIGPAPDTPPGSTIRVVIHDGTSYVTTISPTGGNDGYVPIPDVPTEFVLYSQTPLTNVYPRLYIYPASNVPFRVGSAILERVSGPGKVSGPFFDGSSPDVDKNFYYWDYTADQSTSYINTWN